MVITERKVFLQTLKNARSRVILLDRLKSSILDNLQELILLIWMKRFNVTSITENCQ